MDFGIPLFPNKEEGDVNVKRTSILASSQAVSGHSAFLLSLFQLDVLKSWLVCQTPMEGHGDGAF